MALRETEAKQHALQNSRQFQGVEEDRLFEEEGIGKDTELRLEEKK
jgi:hypothetical protein